MNPWLGPGTISSLSFVCLLLFACSPLGQEQDTEGGSAYVVIGGVVIPDEGPAKNVGYALEGEDVMSPGPTITVRAGEPVTITLKIADERVPESHDFFIVAEKDNRDVIFPIAEQEEPLWGAGTELLSFGEQQTITFTPDTPGSYFYICTHSGHLRRGMWGSFIVEE